MVSFWPWGSKEDAASFERTLSTLSTKISKTAANNDALRQRSRRVRVMWTLYAGFAYILAALILVFVTGWRSWGPTEISAISGGPVLIYIVRKSMTTYYDYRISNTQAYLERLNKERDTAIERLKAATKYNTTQQLLEKYGSAPKPKNVSPPSSKKKPQEQPKAGLPQGPRTGIAPPPTANIRRSTNQRPSTPQAEAPLPVSPPGSSSSMVLPPPTSPGEEFAPNAFEPPDLKRQYSSSTATYTQSHWYDRIMDALLGEDETQPKNRLALICTECRLVNGQAPPGTRVLEDVGRWRCGGCGAWNGKEKAKEEVVAGLVRDLQSERRVREVLNASADSGVDSGDDSAGAPVAADDDSGGDMIEDSVQESKPLSRSTRSKSKAKGRK